MRLIHVADIHAGATTHAGVADAILVNLARVVEAANTEEVDAVLVAGDIFHHRNPSAMVMEQVWDVLKHLRTPLVMVPGNHDTKVGRAHSLFAYTQEERSWYVLREAGSTVIQLPRGLLVVHSLPWQAANFPRSWWGPEEVNQNIPSVLLAHATVPGAVTASLFGLKGDECTLEPKEINELAPSYAALGHIHRAQVVANCSSPTMYAGSLVRMTFADAEQQRGYVFAELGGSGVTVASLRPLSGPEFKTYNLNLVHEPIEEAVKSLERDEDGFAGVITRVRVKLPTADRPSLKPIEDALRSAREVVFQFEYERHEAPRLGNVRPESLTPREALALYLSRQEVSKERREELNHLASELIEEVYSKERGRSWTQSQS